MIIVILTGHCIDLNVATTLQICAIELKRPDLLYLNVPADIFNMLNKLLRNSLLKWIQT